MRADIVLASSNLSANLPLWWLAQLIAIAILVWLFLRWRPNFLRGRSIRQTLNDVLDARQQQIQTQLEAAQRSREEAARINEQAKQEIAQARKDAEEIVTRAAHTSEAIQQEMQKRAREEYERIIGQARVQIDYEREQAELALRRRASDIVVDAAGQIVERYLEPQTDRQIIDSSLADLKEIR
jgi:F-type H+-transporting ATPase subunit b